MKEKNKVEQFEEELEKLVNDETVFVDLHYSDYEAAKELIEKLDPSPEEREEMEDMMSDYESAERDMREEMMIDELTEKVGRYGGNTKIVKECVEFYRKHGYAKDSTLETYADFAELPGDDEEIYWGYYFEFFPDAKVPEGMTTYDYLVMQYELRDARDSAFSAIDWFLWGVGHRLIELRYGFPATGDQAHTVYRANDFKNFYPEFVAAYKEVATATVERAAEIRKTYVKLQSKTKSTARRLLKITPELKIPEEVKRRIQGDLSKT